jgi:iduronate 2-sulfatase
VWTIGPFFRNTTTRGRDAVTLPQALKNAGFHTESFGKVFHVQPACYVNPIVTGGKDGCINDPDSWSVPAWLPDPYEERGNATTARGRNPTGNFNPAMESWVAVDADDDALPDGNITTHAVAALARIKRDVVDAGGRFMLGVGFLKPHLPQVFPKKYLDMYTGLKLPTLAANPFPPKGSPVVAWGDVMQEISEYSNIVDAKQGNTTDGPFALPAAVQTSEKLAYHACTTYVDAQIGRVLASLESLGLRDNTIVAVIGDHGWKLGEHGGWAKKTNFYNDARGLLLVSDPRQNAQGQRVDSIVEYVAFQCSSMHFLLLVQREC